MHLFDLFSVLLSLLCAYIKKRASCCKVRTERWSNVVNIDCTPGIAVTLLLQFLIVITINKRKCCSRNERKHFYPITSNINNQQQTKFVTVVFNTMIYQIIHSLYCINENFEKSLSWSRKSTSKFWNAIPIRILRDRLLLVKIKTRQDKSNLTLQCPALTPSNDSRIRIKAFSLQNRV
jgi:hypothetical protein